MNETQVRALFSWRPRQEVRVHANLPKNLAKGNDICHIYHRTWGTDGDKLIGTTFRNLRPTLGTNLLGHCGHPLRQTIQLQENVEPHLNVHSSSSVNNQREASW